MIYYFLDFVNGWWKLILEKYKVIIYYQSLVICFFIICILLLLYYFVKSKFTTFHMKFSSICDQEVEIIAKNGYLVFFILFAVTYGFYCLWVYCWRLIDIDILHHKWYHIIILLYLLYLLYWLYLFYFLSFFRPFYYLNDFLFL